MFEELGFDALRFLELALDAAATGGDGFGAPGDAGDTRNTISFAVVGRSPTRVIASMRSTYRPGSKVLSGMRVWNP